MGSPYSQKFYDNQSAGSGSSAAIIVPRIVDLLQPKSVLDVGCGVGTWCRAFQNAGVDTVYGIDGPWVKKSELLIDPERFISFDFSGASVPFAPPLPARKFDLAISLEMFEHVDQSKAGELVAFITAQADLVIMGAAIPGQGGVHHVNERWPSYWRELFEKRGFRSYDLIRPLVWEDKAEPWYPQNMILYHRADVPERARMMVEAAALERLKRPADMAHPALFEMVTRPNSLGKILKEWLKARLGK